LTSQIGSSTGTVFSLDACFLFLWSLLREVIGGWDASHPPTEEGEEGRGKNFLQREYTPLLLRFDEPPVKPDGISL
jgi:hypothetical protein